MPSISSQEQQFVALYRELGPAVYRRCLRLLQDRELARDATQDIFLKLMRGRIAVDADGSPLPFVYRAALHHCLNVRRNARRRARHDLLLSVREEAREAGYDDAVLGQDLLNRFDSVTQVIAVGVLVDGVQQEDLASALRISPKTVSRKLRRFVSNARKFLARSDV